MHDRAAIDLPGVHEVVDETDDGHATEHSNTCPNRPKLAKLLHDRKRSRPVNIPQFIDFASTLANNGKKLITVENTS